MQLLETGPITGARLWNSLSLHIVMCDTVSRFQRELKTFLCLDSPIPLFWFSWFYLGHIEQFLCNVMWYSACCRTKKQAKRQAAAQLLEQLLSEATDLLDISCKNDESSTTADDQYTENTLASCRHLSVVIQWHFLRKTSCVVVHCRVVVSVSNVSVSRWSPGIF